MSNALPTCMVEKLQSPGRVDVVGEEWVPDAPGHAPKRTEMHYRIHASDC